MDLAALYGNKIAVVTGGASGIGKALVLQLRRSGASIVAVDRDLAALATLQRELPDISILPLDLTDRSAGEQLLSFAIEKHGRIDILFNNAGVIVNSPFAQLPLAAIERIIAVNLLAPITITKAVLPYFIERDNGIIAFTGSISAHIHSPQNSVYTATKGGLHNFVAAVRRELPSNSKVQLSIIHPGTTKTAFFSETDLEALGNVPIHSPDDVAKALLSGVARGQKEIFITLKARISMWIERIWPRYFDVRFRSLDKTQTKPRERSRPR
jgi:short-subunit dehydrogenase